jgi:hypothetical protein
LLLCVAASQQERFGREIDGRGKRHRRQRPAHFFRDHAQLEMTGTGAAILFRDRDAEKAHLGEPLPQLAIVIRLAVEHDADRLRRTLLGEEFSRLVAQLFLVIGEIEIHGCYLLLSVIPGRDKVASPESITPACGYGFRACAFRRIPD